MNHQINITKNGITTLDTVGKYCDRNIDVVTDVQSQLQEKLVTPKEFPQTITADEGYDGISKVEVADCEEYLTSILNETVTVLKSATGTKVIEQKENTNLTQVIIPNATSIPYMAFQGCSNLSKIDLRGATQIEANAFALTGITEAYFPNAVKLPGWGSQFQLCENLSRIRFNSLTNIEAHTCFNGCFRLVTFVLASPSVCNLTTTDAFTQTPIVGKKTHTLEDGYIYVPRALVDSYKTATNWSVYADKFRAIEDYPNICEWEW